MVEVLRWTSTVLTLMFISGKDRPAVHGDTTSKRDFHESIESNHGRRRDLHFLGMKDSARTLNDRCTPAQNQHRCTPNWHHGQRFVGRVEDQSLRHRIDDTSDIRVRVYQSRRFWRHRLDNGTRLTDTPGMHAAGYVRSLPGSPHHTLYAQREQLRLWSRDSNTPLVAVFQDEADAEDRPGLRALWISLDEFDVVVAESLDVFAANVITQELIAERLQQAGISAVVADAAKASEQEQPS